MKRALYFFLLAALVWLVVQPNLAAGTREPEVRVPVYGVDLQTSTQITKDQCDSQSVIVIDPAAGGADAGYDPADHISEKDLAMDIAVQVGEKLADAGYQVAYTRWYDDIDSFATEQESDTWRLNKARELGGNYMLSLRFTEGNDGLDRGFSVFTQPNNALLESLATHIAQNIQATNFTLYEGLDTDHYANFPVLSDAGMPSVLLQLGYLTNNDDYTKLSDPEFRDQLADAIVKAFLQTVN